MRLKILPLAAALLMFAAGSFGPNQAVAESTNPAIPGSIWPSPGLAPAEVVRIQLDALRGNNESNQGIAVAFRFASPRNKATTGPLPRFIRMIKADPYRLMLDYEHASYLPIWVKGPHALQRVTLVGRNEVRSYDFLLQSQDGPHFEGCWMTEAVLVVPGPEHAI